MDITILVEPTGNNGFRAICGEPLREQVDASTRQEAVNKLRERIEARLASGAEVLRVAVGTDEHPLAPFVGTWRDDELLGEWRQAIEEYRTERDRNTDAP